MWGIICGDGWSLLEASVVCHQLNLGYAQDAPQTNYFGGDVTEIVTSGVKCNGQEQELSECLHDDISTNSSRIFCPGNGKNFASVICTDSALRFPTLIEYALSWYDIIVKCCAWNRAEIGRASCRERV